MMAATTRVRSAAERQGRIRGSCRAARVRVRRTLSLGHAGWIYEERPRQPNALLRKMRAARKSGCRSAGVPGPLTEKDVEWSVLKAMSFSVSTSTRPPAVHTATAMQSRN